MHTHSLSDIRKSIECKHVLAIPERERELIRGNEFIYKHQIKITCDPITLPFFPIYHANDRTKIA